MHEALFTLCGATGILLLSQLSPGPDVVLVFRAALTRGWKAGSLLGMGTAAAAATFATIFCIWGSWILEQSWSPLILVIGGCYMLYLTYQIVREILIRRQPAMDDIERPDHTLTHKPLTFFIQGYVTNITNVKFMLFFCGITAIGLEKYGTSISWYKPSLVIACSLINVFGWTLWSILLQWRPLRQLYQNNLTRIESVVAVALSLLGGWMIVDGMGQYVT